jgi:hypothetical protein
MDLSTRTLVGSVLIIVGSVMFAPAMGVAATEFSNILLVPATILLTAGTYLVGTDVSGSPA